MGLRIIWTRFCPSYIWTLICLLWTCLLWVEALCLHPQSFCFHRVSFLINHQGMMARVIWKCTYLFKTYFVALFWAFAMCQCHIINLFSFQLCGIFNRLTCLCFLWKGWNAVSSGFCVCVSCSPLCVYMCTLPSAGCPAVAPPLAGRGELK